MVTIEPLTDAAPAEIEALLDRAFGTDRFDRTAYRLRAGVPPIATLCFAALDGSMLVGSIQCWPVALLRDDGGETPMVLVGPVAVDPARQQEGIGRRLTDASLAAAAARGLDAAMMLIGDADYYGRFFGFDAARTGGWRLPGPVERHRLLARGPLVPDAAGVVAPRIAAAA